MVVNTICERISAYGAVMCFSGFSTWLVKYLIALRGLPVWVINLIVSIIAATLTEVVSNTATANVLLPILVEMSLTLCQNPTYLGKQIIIVRC